MDGTQLTDGKEKGMEQAKKNDGVVEQPKNPTTGVMALLTAKPGVTREQVTKFMPAEIRATVRLYLDGAMQQWYARADGKGAVFILNCKDAAEAEALIDKMPLSGANLLDHQFIPIGPLAPLGSLLGGPEVCPA
jgi:hypothetical protein